MNHIMPIMLIGACLGGVVEHLPAQQHSLPDAARERIDALLAPFDSITTPGCAIGAVRDGQVLLAHGYGMADLAAGTRLSSTSVLGIASLSKQFTAAAVALLVEDGQLTIEDDIRRWLPEMPSYNAPIRIRDLLYQTSGLRDHLSMTALAGRDEEGRLPVPVAMELIARQRGLNHPPGHSYSYSNTNYFLLARIVERASGLRFATFMQQRVFQPLGMMHTRFAADGEVVTQQAESYREGADGRLQQVSLAGMLSGEGGAYSTVADLARWEANLLVPRLGRDPEALVRLLRTHETFADGRPIGYGWGTQFSGYRGAATEGHGGTWGGFRSYALRLPAHKFAAIALCNRLEISPFQVTRRLADIVLGDSLAPSTDTAASLRTPTGDAAPSIGADAAPGALTQYTGRFSSDELETTYVIAQDSAGLTLATPWTVPQRLRITHADTLTGPSRTLVVRRDSAGGVTGFTLNSGRVREVEFSRRANAPLRIPRGGPVTIDGIEGDGEWTMARQVEIVVAPSYRITVRVQHDNSALLVAFSGFRNTDSAIRVPEVLLDPRHDGGSAWGPDDWWFHASARDCANKGRFNDYAACTSDGTTWSATNIRGGSITPAVMELRIPLVMVGLSVGSCFGIAFDVTNTQTHWEFWPATATLDAPASWSEGCLE